MKKYDRTQVFSMRGLLLPLLVAAWLVGILLCSWFQCPFYFLAGGAVLALLTAYICRRKPAVRSLALVFLLLCLGAWRYMAVSAIGDTQSISALISQPTLTVMGTVTDEPELETNSTLLLVEVDSISTDGEQSWRDAHGEIEVQTPGSTFDDPYAPRYGDTLQLTGRLTKPPAYSSPEILASMTFPSLSIEDQNGNPLLVALYQLRTTLAGILLQALPQPSAALLIALFLSLRTPALKPLLSAFNVTGTAHLIAPSGFKITVLAGLILSGTGWLVPRKTPSGEFLLPAQRRRDDWKQWLRTLLVILCIVGYTFLSGGGPAAIRAGIMGSLLALAPRLGRNYHIFSALALSALLMSFFDPFILRDTGFQLSFIGTLGIALFTPFFQHCLRFLQPLPLGLPISEIMAVTLAAQVATLPIFALNFNTISFIAPFANIVSVPLLGILLSLGALTCLSGLISIQLAIICGWLVWPLLWYLKTVIFWCAQLPWAYLRVDSPNLLLAWLYYAVLAGITALLLTHWQPAISEAHQQTTALLSRRTGLILKCSLILLILLGTELLALNSQMQADLTITLLISGNSDQGEALLLHTPDGQSALIDEDATSAILSQALDAHLPYWQRSLNLVILTDTSANDLAGLQDIITRYQVAQVIDGGMLHPSTAYALWRRTLRERAFPYTQVRQGATIRLGNQVRFQVLWPLAHLHKSSTENYDNALILRLIAPGLQMLLLNSATLSSYALKSLPESIAGQYLQADIAQIANEQDKAFPVSLSQILTLAQPKLLFITTLPDRMRKASTLLSTSPPLLSTGPWQIIRGQTGSLTLSTSTKGWKIDHSP
jgi:competence protein ComEC